MQFVRGSLDYMHCCGDLQSADSSTFICGVFVATLFRAIRGKMFPPAGALVLLFAAAMRKRKQGGGVRVKARLLEGHGSKIRQQQTVRMTST